MKNFHPAGLLISVVMLFATVAMIFIVGIPPN